jgi:hypothetical protein
MGLVDKQYIAGTILNEAAWSESHGAAGEFLGTGMLYYSLAYMHRAQVAVCLGSGGGFVPRLMRQAQRDLGLSGARTILVDANLPEAGWDSPKWLDDDSFFRRQFPDIELRVEKTIDAAYSYFVPNSIKIDYLHIDADHSFLACLFDFQVYSTLLSPNGVISFHDTSTEREKAVKNMGVPEVIRHIRNMKEWDVLDFPNLGAGSAVVKRKPPQA